jgi:hypothetical protein
MFYMSILPRTSAEKIAAPSLSCADYEAETLCLYFFLSFLSASSPPLHSGNVLSAAAA